jgi:hypothetical protein
LAIAAGLAPSATAQSAPQAPISLATPPVLALPGDNLLLCAINLAPGNSLPQETISFQFEAVAISYTSETAGPATVLGSTQITLPPLDSGVLHPPGPCIQITIPVAAPTAPPATPALVAGLLRVNPQPLPPGAATLPQPLLGGCLFINPQPLAPLAASLQVFTPGTDGEPTNIRLVSFRPPQPC